MSNPPAKKAVAPRLASLVAVFVPMASAGQSAPLLESIRFQRAGALRQAQSELANCQRTSCDRLPHLSLLVGYLSLSEGDANAAIDRLTSVAPPPLLEPFHAYYLGEAHFYAHQPRAALAEFARASAGEPEWLAERARARQGELLLEAGDAVAALSFLSEAAPALNNAELYFQRSLARRAIHDAQGEIADLKVVALRFVAHPYAAAALDRLGEIPAKAARLSADEHLSRARLLLEAGKEQEALHDLDLARGNSRVVKARIAQLRADALFRLKKDSQAQLELARALKGPALVAAEAALFRAHRALATQDREQARAYMAEIDRKYPREPAAEEAGFFVGWLDLQMGQLGEAVRDLAAYERRHPRSRWRGDAFWFRALALMLQEQRGGANLVLKRLLQTLPKSELVPQARYWMARNDQLAGEESEVLVGEYEQVIRQFPGSFYALLSAVRLDELGHRPPPAFPDPPSGLEASIPRELQLAVSLEANGLFKDATKEWQEQSRDIDSSDEALPIAHLLQGFGEYGLAYELANRLLWSRAYGRKEAGALGLFYPLPYQGIVQREAKSQNLDPYLIWAVMRRESAFRPGAISSVNARGLMQVMPSTGRAVSQATAMQVPSDDDLFSPEINIRLASWYLARLLERFGHPALCVAAYNAGPEAVARWVRARREVPLDLFVEEIPYRQTRGYVKQVIADYFIYHQLYDRSAIAPKLSLTVPETMAHGVNF